MSFKITEFTSISFSWLRYLFRVVFVFLLSTLVIGVEIITRFQVGCCLLIKYFIFFNFSYVTSLFLQRASFVPLCIMTLSLSGVSGKEGAISFYLNHSALGLGKTNFHLSVSWQLTSFKPAIIESPTFSVVPGFHSSVSVLLSVQLLDSVDTSDCVVGNIGGVSDCFVDL